MRTLRPETICGDLKSFKIMKNALYFTLKSFFVLKIFKFFGHKEKRLDWKNKVHFKFMTSQPGKQTIAIQILPNISRSKGNQTVLSVNRT